MSVRRAVPLLLAATLLPTPEVGAAHRRVCYLVADTGSRRADNAIQEAVLRGSTREWHIKSADIASNTRHLTAVIRMHSPQGTDPTSAAHGRIFHFGFAVRGTEYERWWFEMWDNGAKQEVHLWRSRTDRGNGGATSETRFEVAGAGRGTVDRKRGEFRMTVPVALLGPVVRWRHAHASDLGASVDQVIGGGNGAPREAGVRWLRHAVDARPRTTYPLGAPSCVRPG